MDLLALTRLYGPYAAIPEVDRIWGVEGLYHGSSKDHSLSTFGWLHLVMITVLRIKGLTYGPYTILGF